MSKFSLVLQQDGAQAPVILSLLITLGYHIPTRDAISIPFRLHVSQLAGHGIGSSTLYKEGTNRSAQFLWKYTGGPLFTAGNNELISYMWEAVCHNPNLPLFSGNQTQSRQSHPSGVSDEDCDLSTENKCQWLKQCCVFQNPTDSQGKRNKRICNVWWVRMLSPGRIVSLSNYTDTVTEDKPGKVCCGCPGRLGDKNLIYLTWLVNNLPCF